MSKAISDPLIGAWVGWVMLPPPMGLLVVVVATLSTGQGPLYRLWSELSLQWALERSQLKENIETPAFKFYLCIFSQLAHIESGSI